MNSWDSLQKDVNARLDLAFAAAQERYFRASPMREMLDFHFRTGGKRLRPLLTFAVAQTAAGRPLHDLCTPYALAVELIHNATLIHDDLQDGDRTRRGAPTLWHKYSPAQAINCGDAWFFVPQLLVQDAPYAPALKLELLDLLQRKTFAVIEGQSQEFALKEKFAAGAEISRVAYLEMVEGKTSALFLMPLLGGALIAGASQIQELQQAAVALGRAFQIQDDLLDLWGDKGRGQSGSDIAEGKLSYPLVLLLAEAGAEQARLKQIILAPREHTSAADVAWVIALMEERGVKERARTDFLAQLEAARKIQVWSAVVEPVAAELEARVNSF